MEALEIIHAISMLEFYLCGMPEEFVVFSDYKPLKTTMDKALGDISNDRLSRMMEKVAWPHYKVKYLPAGTR